MKIGLDPSDDDIGRVVREAKTVAVVGMKDESRADAPAFTVPAHMKSAGIRVIPVNPTIASSLGEPSRARLADVGERVDVVQVFRRAEDVPDVAKQVLALPVELRPSVVWLQSGIVNEAAASELRGAGIPVIMDRCFAVEMALHRRG